MDVSMDIGVDYWTCPHLKASQGRAARNRGGRPSSKRPQFGRQQDASQEQESRIESYSLQVEEQMTQKFDGVH